MEECRQRGTRVKVAAEADAHLLQRSAVLRVIESAASSKHETPDFTHSSSYICTICTSRPLRIFKLREYSLHYQHYQVFAAAQATEGEPTAKLRQRSAGILLNSACAALSRPAPQIARLLRRLAGRVCASVAVRELHTSSTRSSSSASSSSHWSSSTGRKAPRQLARSTRRSRAKRGHSSASDARPLSVTNVDPYYAKTHISLK